MRSGAWLAFGGLAWALALGPATGACSGGYPLPPTRCDEWCDVTKGMQCEDYYEPADCVSQCEQAHFGAPECGVLFDSVLSCYRKSPRVLKQLCSYPIIGSYPIIEGVLNDCQVESAALIECVGYLNANESKH